MFGPHDNPPGDWLDFERLRASRPEFEPPELDPENGALPAFLGRVVSTQMSIRAGQFCRVMPTSVLGAEREGGSAAFAPFPSGSDSPAVLVYLMGSFVPRTGDYLVCRRVDHRWVAETSGGSISHGTGVLLPSCFCAVPSSLQMTSAAPQCNYNMFQSCTIRYGPPPAAMVALNFSANVFTSSASFLDPVSQAKFFYYFWCQYNQFFLTRIFPTSPFGSPYRDAILYTWVVGGYGNTCQPFLLASGTPYPGSDESCSVSISGG